MLTFSGFVSCSCFKVFMYVAFVVFTYFRVYSHSCCRLWGVFVFVVCLFVLFGLCAYFVVFCLCVFLVFGFVFLVVGVRLRLCACLWLVFGLRLCAFFVCFWLCCCCYFLTFYFICVFSFFVCVWFSCGWYSSSFVCLFVFGLWFKIVRLLLDVFGCVFVVSFVAVFVYAKVQ